jgi:hypothetical protein
MDQDENGILFRDRVKSSTIAYNMIIVYYCLESETTKLITLNIQRSRCRHGAIVCRIACVVVLVVGNRLGAEVQYQ